MILCIAGLWMKTLKSNQGIDMPMFKHGQTLEFASEYRKVPAIIPMRRQLCWRILLP